MQESKCSFDDIKLAPATLAELLSAIDEGVVSGKMGKQVLPALLQVRKAADLPRNACTQSVVASYHCVVLATL